MTPKQIGEIFQGIATDDIASYIVAEAVEGLAYFYRDYRADEIPAAIESDMPQVVAKLEQFALALKRAAHLQAVEDGLLGDHDFELCGICTNDGESD